MHGQLTLDDTEIAQLRALARAVADAKSFEFPELRDRARRLVSDSPTDVG